MRPGSTHRYLILGIVALAFALRMAAAVWWQGRLDDAQSFGMPDSHGYWDLGQRIAAGRPYEYGGPEFRVFRAPSYPLVLAGLFRVLGEETAVIWRGVSGPV